MAIMGSRYGYPDAAPKAYIAESRELSGNTNDEIERRLAMRVGGDAKSLNLAICPSSSDLLRHMHRLEAPILWVHTFILCRPLIVGPSFPPFYPPNETFQFFRVDK
ncbi:hypothetical protein WG66_008932 [Moniliophthora roreri]|nr:hypothetical protein WG66_008932 [Moniliophthora roreri]